MMPQRHSIVTVAGRNKHAAKAAANEAIIFTEIALGSGDRYPGGGEAALEAEVHRGAITNTGTMPAEPNAMYFDLYVEANVATFHAQEIGLFDEDGVLYALSRFDQPVPKFGPDSAALSDNTFRIVVVFSDTENVVVQAAPLQGVTDQRQINTQKGLSGGGDLSQDRTLVTDWSNLPNAIALAGADTLNIRQANGGEPIQGEVTLAQLIAFMGVGDFASDAEFYTPNTTGKIAQVRQIWNIIARSPTYPEALTGDHRLSITAGAGQIVLDEGQFWLWRGLGLFSSDKLSAALRTFVTAANKLYHLRWHAPGTGLAVPLADFLYGCLELLDMDGLTETDSQYDSTYDRMLIAKVETDGANAATITPYANAKSLSDEVIFAARSPGSFAAWAQTTASYNWARTPTAVLSRVTPPAGSYDSDYDIRPTSINRDEMEWWSWSWHHTGAAMGSPGFGVRFWMEG